MVTPTGISGVAPALSAVETLQGLAGLASCWSDATVRLRLPGVAAPPDIGSHLRRSFLGALAMGASDEARANRPCPWDPPCALDVFMREQFRDSRGNGLPKPYVVFAYLEGADLVLGLRIFGAARSWLHAAAEALVAGVRDILPWRRLAGRGAPPIASRTIDICNGVEVPRHSQSVGIEFVSPVDVSGVRTDIGRSLLSRILRRVVALSRWQGAVLSPEATRGITALFAALDIDDSGLVAGHYLSPNRRAQRRDHATRQGVLRVKGDLEPILPLLAIGERCHVGRASVEGLGRFRITT